MASQSDVVSLRLLLSSGLSYVSDASFSELAHFGEHAARNSAGNLEGQARQAEVSGQTETKPCQ